MDNQTWLSHAVTEPVFTKNPSSLKGTRGCRGHCFARATLEEDAMGRATAHPDHQCISSEDIHGTEVYGPDRNNIGEIDHLIIDKVSGRVAYAVMSFGGIMGLGHSHYPIPWGALTYDTSLGGFRTNITEQQLKDAPEFSDDSWQDRDWEVRTHRHYSAPSFWELGARA
jgi:hypothetical protein